jgi:hypothetical protein
MFIIRRPPPLIGSCLGWSSNFVGSESGQIQSVKLLQNMVSNRTPQLPPPPLRYTLYTVQIYSILIHTGKGGVGGENQRWNMTECISSL